MPAVAWRPRDWQVHWYQRAGYALRSATDFEETCCQLSRSALKQLCKIGVACVRPSQSQPRLLLPSSDFKYDCQLSALTVLLAPSM